MKDLTVIEWISFGVLALMTPFALWQMPKYWRGDAKELYDEGTSLMVWGLGDVGRRAFLRSVHLGVLAMPFMLLSMLFAFLGDAGRLPTDVAHAWGFRSILIFCAIGLVDVVIVLFNRPKFLVPKVYRRDPGLVPYAFRFLFRPHERQAPDGKE